MFGPLIKGAGRTGYLFTRAGWKFFSRPGEALLLCRIAWWVGVLSVAARLYPLPRALQIVSAPTRDFVSDTSADIQVALARAVDMVLSVNVSIFKPSCWKRAAILHRYLSQNGMSTRIVFGVRNDGAGALNGHAWLELAGQPILESTPPEYVVTYSFPSNQRFDTELALLSRH